MIVNLFQPSFEIPPLEDIIRDVQGTPIFTQVSHGLQTANQSTLLELLLISGVEIPEGPIFVAGGGDGLELALAPYTFFAIERIGRRTIISIDKDPKKVKKSREVAKYVEADYRRRTTQSLTYIVQDPQDIVGMDTRSIILNEDKSPLPQFALVWSSSVIHWLKTKKEKFQAFDNFYSILKNDGVLCISMSAGGTASDFLAAYFNVFQRLGPYDRIGNPQGYHIGEFEEDPIGSRPVDEIANMLKRAGFEIVLPLAIGESIRYTSPKDYVNAVEIYGRDEFLKSLPHTAGEKTKRKIWSEMEEEFLGLLRRQGWRDGDPWEYTQYNNYLIARKKRIHPTIKKERLYDLSSILNEKFLTLGYKKYLVKDKYTIAIKVSGDPTEISGKKTEINLTEILGTVLAYASSDWVDKDANPVCEIQYSIVNRDALVLKVNVRTKNERDPTLLFKQGSLKVLQDGGVNMSYINLEGGVKQYEFRVPLH